MSSILTKKFNINNAKNFILDIASNTHYMFVGRHIPYLPDDSSIPTPNTSIQTNIDAYDNMIFGKRITNLDVAHTIPRKDWVPNKVYSQYDHNDGDLFEKDFYTVVADGSIHYVYKCLYNNNNANSVSIPSGTDIEPFETPVDGYVWKYLYTISDANWQKFTTTKYIPVYSGNAASTSRSIEVIDIEDAGIGYNNYITGEFRLQDIKIGGDERIYGIDDTASAYADFYNGCVLKITSGSAADQYRIITDYNISGGIKKITLESKFDIAPNATDTYEIYPFVYVYGDGNETANCFARAIINPSGNTVSKIDILNSGAGFNHAVAVIRQENIVGVTREAALRPIISPYGGHGSDNIEELCASKIEVSVKFNQSESGFIPDENDYRTVGIIEEPHFDNVAVKIITSNTIGNFVVGENITQYKDTTLTGTVTLTASNSGVIGSSTLFKYAIDVEDYVLITDGRNNHISKVISVANDTYLTLAGNSGWSNSSCKISKLKFLANGNISALVTGIINISDLNKGISNTSVKLAGLSSFSTGVIDVGANLHISINGKSVNNFDTFNQLTSLIGSSVSGNFTIDEKITQESPLTYTQPSAYVHSVDTSSNVIIYATNIINVFNNNRDITGESSDAVMTLQNMLPGDLTLNSGDIQYVEYIAPITRESNKSETIKLFIDF